MTSLHTFLFRKKILLFCPRLKPQAIRKGTVMSPSFVLSSSGIRLLSKFSCTAIPAGSVCRLTQNKHRMAQSLAMPPAPSTVLTMDKQKRQVRSVIIGDAFLKVLKYKILHHTNKIMGFTKPLPLRRIAMVTI